MTVNWVSCTRAQALWEVSGYMGGLSNTVDQNPVVSPCFPSEKRKSSGVKSYQVYWMHWTRIDSDGKVHFLFVRDLEKFRSCWMRGWKVVPMESIGSIGHEQIPMEKFIFYS